eukprot:8271792-Prorocentrum_lima.AAC.1
MDVAAFNYNELPEFGLDEIAERMVRVEYVRRRNGAPRTLPHQYLPIKHQPLYSPGNVIMLRRANCCMFFPQLATWRAELGNRALAAVREVS